MFDVDPSGEVVGIGDVLKNVTTQIRNLIQVNTTFQSMLEQRLRKVETTLTEHNSFISYLRKLQDQDSDEGQSKDTILPGKYETYSAKMRRKIRSDSNPYEKRISKSMAKFFIDDEAEEE